MREEEKNILKHKKAIKRFSLYYIAVLSVVVLLLVLQVIFSESLQRFDLRIIKKIQSIFPQSLFNNDVFKFVGNLSYYYTDLYILNGFLCFLYCVFNPFVSFKIALFFNFAIYLHTISILLVYREPRPYWLDSEVKISACEAKFTGPGYNQFMATLLMLYFIIELKKQKIFERPILQILFIGPFIYLALIAFLFNMVYGHHFLYQNVVGLILAVIVILLADIFDNSLSTLVLKLGFIHRSSKEHKFMVLVGLLLMFSICMAFTLIVESNTLLKPEWIVNYKVMHFGVLGCV